MGNGNRRRDDFHGFLLLTHPLCFSLFFLCPNCLPSDYIIPGHPRWTGSCQALLLFLSIEEKMTGMHADTLIWKEDIPAG